MEPIRRILCPVDFSATSSQAIAFAERLASSLKAEIFLLYVSEGRPEFAIAGQDKPSDPVGQRMLNEISLSSAAVPVQRFLHFGEPGPVICWFAENQHCDLIVIGTHGRQGLARLLLGSVAEYIVRHSRCPVLTVRLVPETEPPLKEPVNLPVPAPRFM
jgi:nucleotide-binding universal stress UspA family protein